MFVVEKYKVRPGFKGFVNQPPSTLSGFINQPPSTMGSWYNPVDIYNAAAAQLKKELNIDQPTGFKDYKEQFGPAVSTDKVPTNQFELQAQQFMQKTNTGTTPDIQIKAIDDKNQETVSRIVLGVIVIGTIILALKHR